MCCKAICESFTNIHSSVSRPVVLPASSSVSSIISIILKCSVKNNPVGGTMVSVSFPHHIVEDTGRFYYYSSSLNWHFNVFTQNAPLWIQNLKSAFNASPSAKKPVVLLGLIFFFPMYVFNKYVLRGYAACPGKTFGNFSVATGSSWSGDMLNWLLSRHS